jgi:hypothetical protein
MHPDDLGLTLPPVADHAQIVANAATAPIGPSQQDHQQQPDDYCAICASMALVATAIASSPPVVIVPIPVRYDWPPRVAISTATPRLTRSFQARGPPSA